MTTDNERLHAPRERWGRVARDVLITFILGVLLSVAAMGEFVSRYEPHDDMAAMAYLAPIVVYGLSGPLVILFLLVGLIRRLETPSLIIIAVLDLAVGAAWAYSALPAGSCIGDCGTSRPEVMPTGGIVLLWAAAIVHIVSAAILALRARPTNARTAPAASE